MAIRDAALNPQILRTDGLALFKVLESLAWISCFLEDDADFAPRGCVLRIDRETLLETLDGSLEILLRRVNEPELEMRFAILRFNRNEFLVAFHRSVHVV